MRKGELFRCNLNSCTVSPDLAALTKLSVLRWYMSDIIILVGREMEALSIQGEPIIKQKVIGQGNFSQVFMAETKSGKVAAIKKVKKSAKDKTAYQLAKKEATVLAGLHSPYVLELLDTFEEHNYFYLVEKYYRGQTLESILKKRKSLSTNESQQIFRNILRGVEYLISKKIVHRDLKPSNIIVNDQNETFLVDLGFACKFDPGDDKVLNQRFGTPFYMSPELLGRELYNSKTDIWSLGVIYYEMLCGHLPFAAATDSELLKVIKDPKTDIFKVQKFIPQPIKDLLKQCLTVDPGKRISWSELFAASSNKAMHESSYSNREVIIYEDHSICHQCCSF